MRNRSKDLSLQQIRTFREVCRQGRYTRVAQRIRLSTPAEAVDRLVVRHAMPLNGKGEPHYNSASPVDAPAKAVEIEAER